MTPARHQSGGEGVILEIHSNSLCADRSHPSPLRGTPLKGREIMCSRGKTPTSTFDQEKTIKI